MAASEWRRTRRAGSCGPPLSDDPAAAAAAAGAGAAAAGAPAGSIFIALSTRGGVPLERRKAWKLTAGSHSSRPTTCFGRERVSIPDGRRGAALDA